jgi:tetratricopeptide (TPR) repeat protein
MTKALILAPVNRFVLRSAARLYMHLDEPDRARSILANEVVLRNDPWLLAAEIAISNVTGITSKFIRNSRDILTQKNYHPFHTAELASALATLELSSGASRKARKLFESSLESPTENSVAQSTWAKRWLPTLEVNNAITATPGTYEARARNAYLLQDWNGVVAASMDWLLDEPFSSRPAVLGSFAAATGLEDYELAVNITRNGLIANPNELGLINNLAFSLANLNKPHEALKELQTASRPAPNHATEVAFKATEGLIDIKLGNWQTGQAKYLDAIALANKESLHKISALASIHYAREMVNIGQLSLNDAIGFVEKISSKYSDPDVDWLIKKLKAEQQKPR